MFPLLGPTFPKQYSNILIHSQELTECNAFREHMLNVEDRTEQNSLIGQMIWFSSYTKCIISNSLGSVLKGPTSHYRVLPKSPQQKSLSYNILLLLWSLWLPVQRLNRDQTQVVVVFRLVFEFFSDIQYCKFHSNLLRHRKGSREYWPDKVEHHGLDAGLSQVFRAALCVVI